MKPAKGFPIRLTVCHSAENAHRIVEKLRVAGFTTDEISVVCSPESCEREFGDVVHEHPAGSQTNKALTSSGVAALGLGAIAMVVGLLTNAGTAVVAVGAFSGLAIAGTFTAMMMTRGAEKELADYYDQAITKGEILVAVETDDIARQQIADDILWSEGTPPAAIPSESLKDE